MTMKWWRVQSGEPLSYAVIVRGAHTCRSGYLLQAEASPAWAAQGNLPCVLSTSRLLRHAVCVCVVATAKAVLFPFFVSFHGPLSAADARRPGPAPRRQRCKFRPEVQVPNRNWESHTNPFRRTNVIDVLSRSPLSVLGSRRGTHTTGGITTYGIVRAAPIAAWESPSRLLRSARRRPPTPWCPTKHFRIRCNSLMVGHLRSDSSYNGRRYGCAHKRHRLWWQHVSEPA